MLKQDLQEQIDELRTRIKILESRTVSLVKSGPSPYDLYEVAKLMKKGRVHKQTRYPGAY